jgi:PadR family transcriptional regulator PadR
MAIDRYRVFLQTSITMTKQPQNETEHEIEVLGQFEQIVLTAVATLGERDAYGIRIQDEARRLSIRGKLNSIGAIHVTLERLEKKGLVTSKVESESRPGRPRRYFKIEAAGVRALKANADQSQRIAFALREAGGMA